MTIETNPNDSPPEYLDRVMLARRQKLAKLRELGVDPFPHTARRTHSVAQAMVDFEQLQESQAKIALCGRIMAQRLMGKVLFADLQDEDAKIQFYVKRDRVGGAVWEVCRLLDIGDIVAVEGEAFVTRSGEKSLNVSSLTLLAKNMRPLPAVKEKDGQVFYEWSDKEERYRRRPIDLLLNRESRQRFILRSEMIRQIRHFLDDQGFIEAETPVLQPLYGGAFARPFTTHHHALDRKLYLRIADELYLKRLIIGGMNRVYEIAKDFRNEGLDRLHSPEFTMMECYAAYEDYTFCMNLTEELLSHLATTMTGSTSIETGDARIEMTAPFRRAAMSDLMTERCGLDILNTDPGEMSEAARKADIELDPGLNSAELIDALFTELVQPHLIEPTFVIDYPVELSPLAKRHRNDARLVERFELYIGGIEFANSFTELNDPFDQRCRFEEQSKLRGGEDGETPPIDEDFLESLELGMPPAAGLGIGMDRLAMLLSGASSLRDVILFPVMRDKR